MKKFIALSTAAAFAFAAPVIAQADTDSEADGYKMQSPVVVATYDDGKATQVRIDGKIYDVCMTAQQDSCINPRAAGLDFGNYPLQYWPGQPASSM